MSYMDLPCLSPSVHGIVINNDIMISRICGALATFVLGPPYAYGITRFLLLSLLQIQVYLLGIDSSGIHITQARMWDYWEYLLVIPECPKVACG